jgi:hypothetical protein
LNPNLLDFQIRTNLDGGIIQVSDMIVASQSNGINRIAASSMDPIPNPNAMV